jgi:ATP-dependent DNA ligase
VKYDGYCLRVERDGDRVRLITRNGHVWAKCFPWIVEAALNNRHLQFVIDGETVVLGVDGVSDFNALHSGKSNDEVQLYAFDILAVGGDNLRPSRCARRALPSCCIGVPTGSSWAASNKARSVPNCFVAPA